MSCHNGSPEDNYAGGGLQNPHPFSLAPSIRCSICHGGNPERLTRDQAHVPPPPEIGDDAKQIQDPVAYFNRLTLTGIDKFDDYEVAGHTFQALDYLQFINPGDLRVVRENRGCGLCHGDEWMARSPLATETGFFSGAMYSVGIENQIPEHRGLYEDTAADLGFRAVDNPSFQSNPVNIGEVGRLVEFPVYSVFGAVGEKDLYKNSLYNAPSLAGDLDEAGRVSADSPLANLYHEMVAVTCGDCHLGSAGANNRYADFRSSGCTACHMRYSLDGRSQSTDPNINKTEPENPDAIATPERAHSQDHLIRSVATTHVNGRMVGGIDDYTCAGCHQGSNRTVLQYWGIRLDQNQDLVNGRQYPANPVAFKTTAEDARLFDPQINNNTFNGRNANQYILFEDYDGDQRDDTPADVHYEAGLGCIDCHGSRDLHGVPSDDPGGAGIMSRMEQVVSIRCINCHGTIDAYVTTDACFTYADELAECALDAQGNALRHVTKDVVSGDYYLVSRLTGERHYVPQTRDVVADNAKQHPVTSEALFNPIASYAMGRVDGNAETGTGPQQGDATLVSSDFSHGDKLDCVACHASWTNNCIGCHLAGEYNDNPDEFFFSNITGERTVFKEANADFVYQSPVPFQLGINIWNEISPISANTMTFFRYYDREGTESPVFTFSDRNGNGNNPNQDGRGPLPALGHNVMMPHSIRGKVDERNEGPRYCVACHLTKQGLGTFGDDYRQFRDAMESGQFGTLDFSLLREHIGKNPGNQLNSPIWVHMVSGLGSGLFLFDDNGCPVNPLDENPNRQYCKDGAPAPNFEPGKAAYNTDRIVEPTGVSNASNSHPMLIDSLQFDSKRDGALNENLSGPLGATLITKLSDPSNGLVLDSWVNANGEPMGVFVCGGQAPTILGTPGDDVLRGTGGPDVIHGLAGNDEIRGLGGDDVLCGGQGADRVLGGAGNDRCFGGSGVDRVLNCESGNW